jgi:hypothetical protein
VHGNESRSTGHDEGGEEVWGPLLRPSCGPNGSFSAAGADEIEGEAADERHVLGTVAVAQAGRLHQEPNGGFRCPNGRGAYGCWSLRKAINALRSSASFKPGNVILVPGMNFLGSVM